MDKFERFIDKIISYFLTFLAGVWFGYFWHYMVVSGFQNTCETAVDIIFGIITGLYMSIFIDIKRR